MGVKPGDLVFFKRTRNSIKKIGYEEIQFDGFGFGVLLGHVPPGAAPPPIDFIFRLMGNIGFVRFDEIAEFIGQEPALEVLRKFNKKYFGHEGVEIPVGVDIRFTCQACKEPGTFVFTAEDEKLGGKKYACAACGHEAEVKIDRSLTPAPEIPARPALTVLPTKKLVGPDGQPVN